MIGMTDTCLHLSEIIDRHDTDKGSVYHNYGRQYDPILRRYRNKNISLLELGVFYGGSVTMWREAFPNAVNIVGVDINQQCAQYRNEELGIHIEIGNATDPDFLEKVNDKYGPFDIIVDDASHTNTDVIKSFEQLFPLLQDDGVYIVEDTNTWKSPQYVDPKFPNHLDYFARFLPFLNQWRFDSETGPLDTCADPFKIMKKTNDIFEATIDQIVFGCSFIAIHKKTRHHWLTT